MQPRKLVMTFRHLTGPKCLITITDKPKGEVEVSYSLRDARGIPSHLAERYLAEWQFWFLEFRHSIVPPDIPSGWR